ncbi:MAG TPA: carboxylating nicotinate-nucleotide diphosphorylase [Acidimicrobiia bacterium]|jgi:nicotinate-nucleotide pyrophosphorylase (carboxylating)|nr:carboxylating nicotinate-nucleotide diphosphorylase [Acidimicrobiia bacterium]
MIKTFDPPRTVVRRLVEDALTEDLGLLGDITTIACVVEDHTAVAAFVSREEGVLAGTAFVTETYRQLDATAGIEWALRDGESVDAGTELGRVTGSLRAILAGERTALNFLSHCSGVASLTRRYVRATHGKARILDTRKTVPSMRAAQKAAVRAGGGFNHRDSLSDAVLIKDNHLAVLGLTQAIERARARWPGRTIEIECESLAQVAEARDAQVDRILLDNMTPDEVRTAVKTVEGRAKIEVSGGVTLDTVAAYAEAGADFISIGAITHSVRILDIGLDIQ